MIKSNLAVLLAERKLKITKVSKDTSISRTTLTSLYYNQAKGIQVDTLNTLCMYLEVTPNQLLSFIPLDIKTIFLEEIKKTMDFSSFIVTIEINDNVNIKRYSFEAICHLIFNNSNTKMIIDYKLGVQDYVDDSTENEELIGILKKIPIGFRDAFFDTVTIDIKNKLKFSGNSVVTSYNYNKNLI